MSIFSLTGTPGAAITTYLADTKNEQTQANKWVNTNPQVKADIAYFKTQAPKLTSADALMKDYRSLKVVLGAFNVSDLLTSPALTKQLLTQDPTSSSSTVRKIGNPSYQIFANAFSQFKNNPLGDSGGGVAIQASNARSGGQIGAATTSVGSISLLICLSFCCTANLLAQHFTQQVNLASLNKLLGHEPQELRRVTLTRMARGPPPRLR